MIYMYKVSEIKELIRALDRSNLSEVTVKGEGKTQLTLKKNEGVGKEPATNVAVTTSEQITPAPVVKETTSPQNESPKVTEGKKESEETPVEDVEHILSPMVGTFYTAPSPDSKPYVEVGDEVKEGEVVCIVEAMKLMNELEAELNGKVVDVLVENGELVEYGQPLFALQASK
jgi:acetyl-CoA carboxylase biotin carboxyl carrier protein